MAHYGRYIDHLRDREWYDHDELRYSECALCSHTLWLTHADVSGPHLCDLCAAILLALGRGGSYE